MIETKLTMEEKQEHKNRKIHGVMEKWKRWRKEMLMWWKILGVWSSSKISELTVTWKLSNHSRWDLMLWENKPHKHLTQFVQSNFSIQIQHVKIHGVRHPIYKNGCLGKQDEQGYDGKCVRGCL